MFGISDKEAQDFLEHATAEFQKALDEYRNKPVEPIPTPEVPAPTPAPINYADPAPINHGVAYTAIAHSGSRWKQYPSGYFDGGYLEAFDGWVRMSGFRQALLDAGGRDVANAPLLHVICRVISQAPASFARGDGGQVVPDRIEYRFIVRGGFEYVVVHSHVSDVTVGQATAIDHVKGVKVSLNPNSRNVGGKRVPGVYKGKDGKEYWTSVRASPYWSWNIPATAPRTLVNYP